MIEEKNSPEKENPKCIKEIKMLSAKPMVDYHRSKKEPVDEFSSRLVHFDSLKSIVESMAICRLCGSNLVLLEKTVGIATKVKLSCENKKCDCTKESASFRSRTGGDVSMKYNAVESYALNCLLVLALQQVGGGAAESCIILTYLGLKAPASFQNKHFNRIEMKLRPTVKKLSNSAINIALHQEMMMTLEDKYDGEELDRKKDDWNNKRLDNNSNGLTVAYDMGWNKRSTGTRYDSISGHGIMVGGKSKKVIGFKAMSKDCSDCKVLKRKHGDSIPIPDHECVKNHDGSSKSMECEAILLMAIEALDKGFSIETIVADDDTTMKKTLRYDYKMLVEIGEMKKEDWPTDSDSGRKLTCGRLPHHIPAPKFLADFNHRVKSVGKAIYALAGLSKKKSSVTKDMAKRINYYWSAMLNQIRHLDVKKDWNKIE